MKKSISVIAALAIWSGAVLAQPPALGTVGLYADEARVYFAACPYPAGYPIAKVDMWIWCLPGENGLMAADFAVSYPENVIRDRITWNPLIATHAGDFALGCSANFIECQWDWVWVAHEVLYVSSHLETFAEIIPHAGVGAYRFLNCEGPLCCWEECIKGTALFLNTTLYPCRPPELAIALETSAWGAIKGFFTR